MPSSHSSIRSRIVTGAGVVASALVALVVIHPFSGQPEVGIAYDPGAEGDGPAAAGPAGQGPSALSSDPPDLAGAFADEATPLFRTDFSDDAAWHQVVTLVSRPVDFEHPDDPDPGEDGYAPYVAPIEDQSLEGVTPAALAETAMAADLMQGYALLADARSMQEAAAGGEVTVVYVDLSPYAAEDAELFHTFPGNAFRCVVTEIASIEANLSIANMDFSEFADNVASDGVFRGFS